MGQSGDASRRGEAAWRELSRYPLSFEVRALFNDMDAFRHVNNIAIARWFEEGRADLNMRVFGQSVMTDPRPGHQLLIASSHIDYLAQVNYPGEVVVGTAVERIGRSSYVIVHALFADGECCALAETVMVKAVDGRGSELSEADRTGLGSFQFPGKD